MEFIADLHIHSHYSRATSKECTPEKLDFWARQKGINLLGTGDFTHRAWRTELAQKLAPTGDGFYVLKNEFREAERFSEIPVRFVVSGEISSIYKKNGRTRKVHNLIILPDLDAAERLSSQLESIGNLHSDGRPILGLDSKTLLEMTLTASPDALFIPAHIWTPHFSVLGANSGFDSIDECYEELTEHIYAVETGLSSDPPMNWRLSDLDRFALVSNSDAHSPSNLAREANIFDTACTYPSLYSALKNNDRSAFRGTIEFFPEEGKYHFDGHRACNIQWEPSATIAADGLCPVCNRKLTVGVLHRTEVLADRPEGFRPDTAREFISLSSLPNIIAASLGCGAAGNRVSACYENMLETLGPELSILRLISIDDIKTVAGSLVAEGVRRVREGQLRLSAGYDGEYGVIEIFSEDERREFSGQTSLFTDLFTTKPATREIHIYNKKREQKKTTGSAEPVSATTEDPDPHQQNAVMSGSGTQMVIAGPGTGKTLTLVNRIGYLINGLGILPAEITAVTFTNKAAAEMKNRCSVFLSKRKLQSLTIGTFHGICLQLLREHAPEKQPVLIDEYASLAIMRELIDEHQISRKPSELLRLFSDAKMRAVSIEHSLDEKIFRIYKLYQEKLASFDAVDFDDLLLKTLHLIKIHSFHTALLKRFGYLLVDEFQDINEVQYELVKGWGEESGNIFIIGDPHQAIYGFRGASPRFFRQFQLDFPETRRISLAINYRSPEAVVESAKSVITHSADAALLPADFSALRTDNRAIRLVTVRNEPAEARCIAETINRIVGGVDMLDAHRYAGCDDWEESLYGFSDIAVLYRTHRQAEMIERSLVQEGIAYRIAGRDTSLYTSSVSTILSLCRFTLNPEDLFSLMVILRHFNASTDIAAHYASGNRTVDRLCTILNNQLLFTISSVITLCQNRLDTSPPRELIELLSEPLGCEDDESINQIARIADLSTDVRSLVNTMTLGSDADIIRTGFGRPQGDAVLLTTLHAAKGLEFPVTFICGLNEGVLPLQDAQGEYADIDEERRLFYVGITRARERLICTSSLKRSWFGEIRTCKPSRFVNDLDSRYILRETWSPEPVVTQMSLF
jgi:uncharacterized protein (TIGR00375 family)